MATLLHLDSSFSGANSTSRKVTAAFVDSWRAAHPDGTVVTRDLAADPIPHLDAVAHSAANTPEADHTPEQAEAWKLSKALIDEVTSADVIIIGAPMYNFTIPSTLKAWLDRLAIARFFVNPATGVGELFGTKVIVATARGGSYAPGTPREGFEFQESYLRAFFNQIGLDQDLTFVHTEMTLAHVVPALAQFKEFAVTSEQAARDTARELATAA